MMLKQDSMSNEVEAEQSNEAWKIWSYLHISMMIIAKA